jgi:hypothetical protein
MKAALGVRFLPDFLAAFLVDFLAVDFLADFLADLLAAVFFLVAIACLPENVRTCVPCGLRKDYRDKQYTDAADLQ